MVYHRSENTVGMVKSVALVGFLLLTSVCLGSAGVCNVPSGSYPSIQSAVNVINCTEIVLTSGSFFGDVAIGRTLELQGLGSDSTTVVGKVTVSGYGTQATLKGLKVAVDPDDLPHDGLVVVGDAEVLPDDLVISTTDQIFADGFERGDTTAWSNTIP